MYHYSSRLTRSLALLAIMCLAMGFGYGAGPVSSRGKNNKKSVSIPTHGSRCDSGTALPSSSTDCC